MNDQYDTAIGRRPLLAFLVGGVVAVPIGYAIGHAVGYAWPQNQVVTVNATKLIQGATGPEDHAPSGGQPVGPGTSRPSSGSPGPSPMVIIGHEVGTPAD